MRRSTEDHRDPRIGVIRVDGTAGHPRGLSPRGRFLAGIVTVFLLLGTGAGLAWADVLPILDGRAPSGAARTATEPADPAGPQAVASQPAASQPDTGAPAVGSDPGSAAVVAAEWDGPAVHLDWTGAEYARAETTFIGDRRAAPGDRVVRTLNVVNAGPGDGVAAVTLDLSEVVPAGALNPDLARDVTLFWDIAGVTGEDTFAALNGGARLSVAEVAVDQGATVPVTVGFAMAAAVDTSNAAGAESTVLSFDVGVNLTGETEPLVPPTLAITGAGLWGLVLLAAGLVVLGFLLVALRRRRGTD